MPEVTSTNSYLMSLVTRHTRSGLVVQATQQTAGRGTHGRVWQGIPGNLFFSVFMKPKCSLADYPQLTHIAALAVAMTLEGLLPGQVPPTIKWPNDVLVRGRKISGILLEVVSDEKGPYGVVMGVGINLVQAPENIDKPATCIAHHHEKSVPLSRLFTQVLRHFHHLYAGWETNGFQGIQQQWLARSLHERDKTLSISAENGVISGIFEGLAPNGALLLRGDDGQVTQYMAGEVLSDPVH